ncbi:uncharacterized protein N0V89_012349 [Didymosphaeria variabile]|uniref:DUF7707 domain-containing protein n=1 Tax=Didymosphaeria variabile TaxID=1932322 RepID=A0A9W8XAG0_9PLEO|nr:uncharacterized protein N0V89_012349 [Didymosphaeria variabile]KAJ4344605.1 hypothetical protein N0V89_012349 [Didymosphaeria variabile]
MLYSALLVATAAFSGLAAAQNSTSDLTLPPGVGACCTVAANDVPERTRATWCSATENTCPEICGGQGQIASGGNTCDEDTLQYTCKCRNGTEPTMAEYEQSVPGLMCRFWFDQCTNATIASNGEGNQAEQFACDTYRNQQCGNKTTADAETTSSTTSGSSGASSTGSSDSATESSSTATSSAASGSSSTPGAAVRLAQEFAAPVLAGGMIALFGIAL